jgi:hypothetical protein
MSAPARATTSARPARIRGLGLTRRIGATLRAANPGLVLITAAGFLFTAYFTVKVTQWVVMTDELQYEKLAVSAGNTLSPIPHIRGHYINSLAQLYPILTAPVYQLFAMPTAFRVVHVLNAAIMASTAIPAYLLAREIVGSRRAAYLVAALTVTVPWMAMSTMMLTEVAAYPAFAWAILGIQRSLAQPSLGRDMFALAGIGLAFAARTQFLLLVPLFGLAILAHEIGYSLATRTSAPPPVRVREGLRSIVRNHRFLTIAGVLATIALPLLGTTDLLDKALGNYAVTVHQGGLLPAGILRASARHLAFVAFGIGILPFVLAAGWSLSSLLRPSSPRHHAYAVLVVLVVVALTLETASFNLRFAIGGPIQDRYLFYIAPLLFVGMAACFLDSRRRWLSVAVTGAAFAWLATFANWEPYGLPFFASPDYVFHSVLEGQSYNLGKVFGLHDLSPTVTVVVGTLLLTGGSAVAIRRTAGIRGLTVASAVVLAFCVVETGYVLHKVVDSIRASSANTVLKGRDWVDESVPASSRVGGLVSPVNSTWDGRPVWLSIGTTPAAWQDLEFWNKTVQRAYLYRNFGDYAPFHRSTASLDFKTGLVGLSDSVDYFAVSASDLRLRLAGTIVTRSGGGFDLLKPKLPYRANWATQGLVSDGWTHPGRPVRLRLYPDRGSGARERRVSIWFQSIKFIHETRRYSLRVGSRLVTGAVPSAHRRRELFDTCVGASRPRDLTIRIAGRTKLPNEVPVGLRITRIQSSPTGRSC